MLGAETGQGCDRSNIVGKPMAMMLFGRGCGLGPCVAMRRSLCGSRIQDLAELTAEARPVRSCGTCFSNFDDLLIGRNDCTGVNRFDAVEIQRLFVLVERINVDQIKRIGLDLRRHFRDGC